MSRPKEFDPDVAVSAAMDVFWQNGYGATTPAELAVALGIGKGSLYNTFENKRTLFEQALRRYGDERVAGLVEVLNQPGPTKARLRRALERLTAPERASVRQRGCLAVNTVAELGARDAALRIIVRGIFERMERAIQTTIEEGQLRREIESGRNAREIAGLFLATVIGMAVIGKTTDGVGPLRRIAQAFIASL
jgi:TetR/AcrR family transcriptional regulator, transcriptional repressor for nem operon